jgi:hypothetical protein
MVYYIPVDPTDVVKPMMRGYEPMDAALYTTIHHRATDRQAFVVAVTGHQRLGDQATVSFVVQAFATLLEQLYDVHGQQLVALSGLAEGADTLFAEAALARGIGLEVCLACESVIENFAPGPARDRFLSLKAQSHRVAQLAYTERSNDAYMALGRWLVDSCDVLIAAWNGLPAAGAGGTGDVVAYARQQGRPVIHLIR